MQPNVARSGFLDMQVCVPEEFTDEQIKAFADLENPCGTEHGWSIRKEGSADLGGAPERNRCCDHPENVHVALDA
jgi:hypothetical protein